MSKMKTSCKSFEVFEFKEETEPESADFSVRFKSRLQNPNPIDKYNFLQSVNGKTNFLSMEIGNVHGIDVDGINSDQNGDSAISDTSLEAEDDSSAQRIPESDDIGQTSATYVEQLSQSRPDKLDPRIDISGEEGSAVAEAASPSNSKLLSAVPNSLSSDEAADMVPDADESMCVRASSTSSDIAEDDDGPSSDHCIGSWEMEVEDKTVVCCPDYIVYRDSYYTNSVLTFSSSCIDVKGSTTDGDKKSFKIHCPIDDIIHIKSHWYEAIETAMVTIHVFSKDSVQAENVDSTLGELKFAVIGPNWYERQEAITSLNVRYKAVWTSMLESDNSMDKSCREAVLEHTGQFFKKYFPNFDEPFEEVVYPKGDSDAVSISKRDVDLLQPDTFVNDTIIDFYIKYLKNRIKPEERHRFHFFNSFFFRKLADPDKDQPTASGGRAAFHRVRKWTRKVNLFEKDYVFIPVNFNYHWSLIVICHLGEVATFQDEDVNVTMKVPCVLHMDSIRGSHTGLKGLVQSYLWEEWKERQKEASEDISSRFDNLRFVSLELPQQQNSFDCGLFLLHYVELFLDQAPVNFNPFKITKSSNFLNVDWFQPAEASLKRVVIQRLIHDLLEHHSLETPSAAGNDDQCTFNCQKTNIHIGTSLEFLSEKCNTSIDCHKNVLSSQADQGIEISLLPSLSLKGSQCASDPSLVMKTIYEPEGMFLDEQYPAFNQTSSFDEYKSSMTPIEEEIAANGQFVYTPSTETGLHQLPEFIPEAYSSQEFRVEASWNSANETGHDHIDSSRQTSISGCEDSVEEVYQNGQVDAEQPSPEEKMDQPMSPLTETLTEPVDMVDVNANGDDLTPSGMQENGSGSEDSSGLESDMQPAAKKMRITTPTLEGEEGGVLEGSAFVN